MNFKVGQKVQIKSKEWYKQNKDSCGFIHFDSYSYMFIPSMIPYLGEIVTIKEILLYLDSRNTYFRVQENLADDAFYIFHPAMIEGMIIENSQYLLPI